MRFGTGPNSFVWPVRWYKTDKPYIPFPNVYNSKDWAPTPRDDEDDGQAGEINGEAHRYRKGDPPPCPNPGTFKGDAAAWAGAIDGKPRFTPCCVYPEPEEGAYDYGYDWGYDVGSV